MKQKIWGALGVVGILVFVEIFVLSVMGFPPELTSPVKFDVLLFRYDANMQPDMVGRVVGEEMRKHKQPRVITYPDDYVPILVSRKNLSKVQNLLGDASVLILSPKLERYSEVEP
jgi:hypothetical protein